MASISWALKLQDFVSGPAETMNRQLRSLEHSLTAVDIASKQMRLERTIDPLRRQRLELQINREQLLLNKSALEQHGGVVRGAAERMEGFRKSLRDWLIILEPVARGLEFIADKAREMIRSVGEAIQTRESALLGLRANLGDKEGTRFYEEMERAAFRYGRSIEEVIGLSRTLIEQGATPRTAKFLTAALEDIHARNPDKFGEVQQGVGNLLTMPVLDQRTFRSLTRGLAENAPNAFREELRKIYSLRKLGDVDLAMSENILNDPSSNLAAWLNMEKQLRGQRGRVGTMAEQFGGNTLEGLLKRIQVAGESAFGSIEKSKGFQIFKGALSNLAKVLGEDQTKGLLTDLADKMGEMLKPLTGPEGRKRMEDFFESMKRLIEGVLPLLSKAARFTEILVRYAAGQRDPNAPQSVGEEIEQFSALVSGDKRTNAERAHALDVMSRPGSRIGDRFNFGLRGAETPVFGPMLDRPAPAQPPPLRPNLKVEVHVDARGATKEDAHEIAHKIKDAVTTETVKLFDHLSIEDGSGK